MHIESVPNRKSHPTILLRESYRADGKVKKRTIANLTSWPEQLVEGLRTLLRGGVALATANEALTISRSFPMAMSPPFSARPRCWACRSC